MPTIKEPPSFASGSDNEIDYGRIQTESEFPIVAILAVIAIMLMVFLTFSIVNAPGAPSIATPGIPATF